jgi:DNA-binding MarR family transcriptional regulator
MKAPPRPTTAIVRTFPRATYLIKELERAVRVRLDEIVEPLGLTAVQYTALSALGRHPGMTSAQLARRSFISPQAANELVAALEHRGLIRRRGDPDGGRALWIDLTTLGERTLAGCDEQVDALEAQLFGEVTRREEAQFREMLRICRDAVRVPVAAPARPRKAL